MARLSSLPPWVPFFQHRLKIQDYAGMLGVTLSHLIETVRTTTGQTPKKMVQDRLLLEAKRLLVHTSHPINDIGDVLSFQSASQFSRWFKHCVGQRLISFVLDSIYLKPRMASSIWA